MSQPSTMIPEMGNAAENGTKLYISNLDFGVSNYDIKVLLSFFSSLAMIFSFLFIFLFSVLGNEFHLITLRIMLDLEVT